MARSGIPEDRRVEQRTLTTRRRRLLPSRIARVLTNLLLATALHILMLFTNLLIVMAAAFLGLLLALIGFLLTTFGVRHDSLAWQCNVLPHGR